MTEIGYALPGIVISFTPSEAPDFVASSNLGGVSPDLPLWVIIIINIQEQLPNYYVICIFGMSYVSLIQHSFLEFCIVRFYGP